MADACGNHSHTCHLGNVEILLRSIAFPLTLLNSAREPVRYHTDCLVAEHLCDTMGFESNNAKAKLKRRQWLDHSTWDTRGV